MCVRNLIPSLACAIGVASLRNLSVNNASVIIRNAVDAVAAVLFPAPCRICGQTLITASRIPICTDCLASFQPITDPMCDCCGRPFISKVAAEAIRPLCRLCRLDSFSFSRARSYAVYNDALHSAILLLKYEEVTRLGDWFATRLAEVVARPPAEFRADVGALAGIKAGILSANAYKTASSSLSPLPQRALGLGTWRVRDP